MTAALDSDPSIRLTHMPPAPISSTIKVLIVDDNEEQALNLARLIKHSWKLDDMPLEVVCVHTLADGLREAADANCTILDLGLPDSGVDASIGAIHHFPPPVIVVTGEDDPMITARCMLAGANGVYVKGQLHGFIPDLFKALQQDIVRRIHGTEKTQ